MKSVFILFALVSGMAAKSQSGAVTMLPYQSVLDIVSCGIKDKNGDLWFGTSQRGVYRYDGSSFVHYTIKHGLCANAVSWIYEDRSGTLWFATDKGVCYYGSSGKGTNGSEKSFSDFHLPLPPVSAVGAEKYAILSRTPIQVIKVLQDKAGMFWFLTTDHGVYRYDPTPSDSAHQESAFTHFLLDETPQCIVENEKGEIFIGSWRGGGVYRYEEGKRNAKLAEESEPHFSRFYGFSDGMISCMLFDKAGNMWVGTRDHAADRYNTHFDGSKEQGRPITNFSEKEGLMNTNVACLLEDSKGYIWFGSDARWGNQRGDAFCYDGTSFRNVTGNEPLTHKEGLVYSVRTIVEDNNGKIWIGSKDGLLLCYDGTAFTDFSAKLEK